MASPVVVDLPHTLGIEEARRRIRARAGDLARHLPGGATVATSWPSENRLALDIGAMGQSLSATIDVEETLVRVSVMLPLMLSFLSGGIAATIRGKGSDLLLGDGSTSRPRTS